MNVLKDLAISESGFVFNPASGESFTVNELGLMIIDQVKSGKTNSEIMEKIIEEYEISEVEVEKDFVDFLNMMKFYNLISD